MDISKKGQTLGSIDIIKNGDVAQLARAFDWQSRGRGFESLLLHNLLNLFPMKGISGFEFNLGNCGVDILFQMNTIPIKSILT